MCAADVGDFSPAERRLLVLGKGKGTQKQPVTLSPKCIDALVAYLGAAGHTDDKNAPLFKTWTTAPNTRASA